MLLALPGKDAQRTMRPCPDGPELPRIHGARFAGKTDHRNQVWRVLVSYFGQSVPSDVGAA
jgi:hypothetical protein